MKGIHDLAVRYARCCNPVPGDEVVGFVTRGRGITVHRTDCINIMDLSEDEKARRIEVEWESNPGNGESYATELQIFTNNRVGLIVDISKVLSDDNIAIQGMNTHSSKNGKVTILLSFEVPNKEVLNGIIGKLRKIQGVYEIERGKG